jgi:hypothetical protein
MVRGEKIAAMFLAIALVITAAANDLLFDLGTFAESGET